MTADDVIRFYEEFSPQSIERMPEIYSDDAFFKDPFNEVRGPSAIQRIFYHMYKQVEEPEFFVKEKIGDDRNAVLVWELHFVTQFFRAKNHRLFAAFHISNSTKPASLISIAIIGMQMRSYS